MRAFFQFYVVDFFTKMRHFVATDLGSTLYLNAYQCKARGRIRTNYDDYTFISLVYITVYDQGNIQK